MPNGLNIEKSRDIRDILQAVREDSRRRLMSRILRKLCPVAVVVGLLNFLLFIAGAVYFGGDAVNGRIEGQRYYLWGSHGGTKGYIEVSQAVFDYSKWHAYSVMITWPLMFLAVFASERVGRRGQN
jgi:hypothetical protein